jgi:hypothetical protein
MPYSFDYAVIRVVPLVQREEFFNVGVILFCSQRKFLDGRIHLDRAKWSAFTPTADTEEVERHLDAIRKICAGESMARANCGTASARPLSVAECPAQHADSSLGCSFWNLRGPGSGTGSAVCKPGSGVKVAAYRDLFTEARTASVCRRMISIQRSQKSLMISS